MIEEGQTTTARILRVDLSSGRTLVEDAAPEDLRDYLGGAGLGTLILHREVPADTDPLSPDNKLVFAVGPLTATGFPSAGRYEVCTKSPLSGTIMDASSGGYWGVELRRAGYYALVVEGVSDHPVYLSIRDGNVECRDAGALWGLDIEATQLAVQQDLGDPAAKVACIGPAGERQVLVACIINDEGRAVGRGGAGAVMGAKNLKAIAVRGTAEVPIARPHEYHELLRQVLATVQANPGTEAMKQFGTAGTMDGMAAAGDVPVRNWTGGLWEAGCAAVGGARMKDTILRKHRASCYRCPVHCARWVQVDRPGIAFEGPGPEYETVSSLGTLCMNDDLEALAYANHLCNLLGVDTISVGAAIAFAMEAYERGHLAACDLGDLKLEWGNTAAIIELVKQIGYRQGLGELLGRGVKRAAAEIGQGSEEYAIHCKGLESAQHDPRAELSLAATYATSSRGACHMHGHSVLFEWGIYTLPEYGITEPLAWHESEGKGRAAALGQDVAALFNSLVVCLFPAIDIDLPTYARAVSYVTGEDYDYAALMQVGERVNNLQRLFNLAAGFTAQDDRLPERQLRGVATVHRDVIPLAEMIQEYYAFRGWDEEGVPTEEKLLELGLAQMSAEKGQVA